MVVWLHKILILLLFVVCGFWSYTAQFLGDYNWSVWYYRSSQSFIFRIDKWLHIWIYDWKTFCVLTFISVRISLDGDKVPCVNIWLDVFVTNSSLTVWIGILCFIAYVWSIPKSFELSDSQTKDSILFSFLPRHGMVFCDNIKPQKNTKDGSNK